MRAWILTLLLLAGASSARADGDGSGVLPFGSAGGLVSGVAEVHPDGTVVITGMCGAIPFLGVGKVSIGSDGKLRIEADLYSDADMLTKKGGAHATHITLEADPEDFTDGNPVDDNVGDVELSGTNAGKGSTPIYA